MSQIKLTEEELKRIQDLNQEFTKAKLEIADNVLRQQASLKQLDDLRAAFGVEEKKLSETYGQDAIIDLATGVVTKKEAEVVEAEEVK
jgi:hypothetical protein|tara:strand:- start:1380 stop:1643 length:264 start_codon:yes stop_codon:yes gene_type:complete